MTTVFHLQAAERALKDVCGEDINGNFIGNAPVGFMKYKYPPGEQSKGFVGAKVSTADMLITGHLNTKCHVT